MKIKSVVTASLIIVLLVSAMIIYLGIFADPKILEMFSSAPNVVVIKNETLNVTIENQTIVQIDNTTTTVACKNSDWRSSVSPSTCPSNSKQVRSWTKISNCIGGISHPSSESVDCNYVPPVTRAS